jgi:hypothetical protein
MDPYDRRLLNTLGSFLDDLIHMASKSTAHRELLEFTKKDIMAALATRLNPNEEDV